MPYSSTTASYISCWPLVTHAQKQVTTTKPVLNSWNEAVFSDSKLRIFSLRGLNKRELEQIIFIMMSIALNKVVKMTEPKNVLVFRFVHQEKLDQ